MLLILAAVALALAALLAQGEPALAGALAQDSPVLPLTTLSPVEEPGETPTPVMTPEPNEVPTAEAPATSPEAANEPPIPLIMLAAIMGVIGLAALGIALRRRS